VEKDKTKIEVFLLNENASPVSGLPHLLSSSRLVPLFICCLFTFNLSYSKDLPIQSFSIRARVSEKTLLGADATEDFKAYDLTVNFELPWKRYSKSGWGMGRRWMVSTGLLHGAGKDALVLSAIPELTLGSEDGRFTLDMGAGGALMSRHRFGTQNFGGPFQFALTMGISIPLYKNLGLGYRFMHYSDAGVWGSNTTGADFHMIELNSRF